MREFTFPSTIEPEIWTVVFHPVSSCVWVNRLVPGRFKHVSAFAYVPGVKAWAIYDVQLANTSIVLIPDGQQGREILAALVEGCAQIQIKRQVGRPPLLRLGFWCVPGVKHLLGLRTGALLPDGLWRHCARHGEVVTDGRQPTGVQTATA